MISLEIGIPVGELLKRITYREYLLYLEHLEIRLGVPERTDYYLMDLASRIHNVGSIRLSGFEYDINKFKIKFDNPDRTKKPDPKKQAQRSKSVWKALLGIRNQ